MRNDSRDRFGTKLEKRYSKKEIDDELFKFIQYNFLIKLLIGQ